MRIALIAALSRNGVIGVNNQLPWHLPNDLKYFRSITWGKPIIMGRRTHESIGRALPGRHNIVVTSDRNYRAEGCSVVHRLEDAWVIAAAEEVMVIGGAKLYEQTLQQAGRLYLTLVDAELEGDTFFPKYDETQWVETARQCHEPDGNNSYRYCYVVLDRKAAG